MTIPQIQETLGSVNVELNRLQDVIADLKLDLAELRSQLAVERLTCPPDLTAGPGKAETLMPYPTPRRGR